MIRWWTVGGLLTFFCSLRFCGRIRGMGVFFLLEKELASLRHLFPCQRKYPHPPIDMQLRNIQVNLSSRFSSLHASRTLRGQLGAGWYLDFSPEKDVRAKRVLFQEKYRCHPASPPPKPSGYERESNSQSVRQTEPEPPKPDQGQPPPLYATSPIATGAWQSVGFPPGSG